jgi:hypothetical protein
MLVDLARNDVNRVCDPLSTRVDKLMVVQKVISQRRHRIHAECDPIKVGMLMDPVLACAAPCLRGVRRAATWQDSIRRFPIHIPCRYVNFSVI